MNPDQKFFVFDGESIGLHGQTFAVAGGVYDIEGKPVEGREFSLHCATMPPGGTDEDRAWVSANVSVIADSVDMLNPDALRVAFWSLWLQAKEEFPGIIMAAECGWPVEAKLLIECVADMPLNYNWLGPYPLHEIATFMLAAGMDPMATYERLPHEMPAHEPLADSRLSARLLATALKILTERAEKAWQYEQLCK